MRTISREELKQKLDRKEDFRLVMALGEWEYQAKHIPGSLHFATMREALASLKEEDEIVVYCSDETCIASTAFGQLLERHGYPHVLHYAGGLADWEQASYPLASGSKHDGVAADKKSQRGEAMNRIKASEHERLLHIYAQTRTIAVVGASADASKAAHQIPRYLQSQGYRILPVNPRGGELFGERVFRSLGEIDIPVDVVEVFRPSPEAPDIARQAIAIGAKVLWLQVGIVSEEARQMAEAAGLAVVMNRCMGATHALLGLGPGPDAHEGETK